MKLTVQLKLLPTEEQKQVLLDTISEYNKACQFISEEVYKFKTFNQFKAHHLTYYKVKDEFRLSSQAIVRAISKVINTYKADKKSKHSFGKLGAITYDSRLLSYKKGDILSIWTLAGRQKISYVASNPNYLPFIKGEADLMYRKGKFYIFQCVDIPEEEVQDVEQFIGVDFGVNNIATLDDGTIYSSNQLDKVRSKYSRTRASLQRKGTRGAKKLLKRLGGREARHASIINHTISKQIVSKAKTEGKGIAIEDLKGISSKRRARHKSQRRKFSSWSFYQLRAYLGYKAKLKGIPCIAVEPYMTSQICSTCGQIGNRKGISFSCSCGYISYADINAARNISALGAAVNRPERVSMTNSISHQALKPQSLG
jgi:putative transposase